MCWGLHLEKEADVHLKIFSNLLKACNYHGLLSALETDTHPYHPWPLVWETLFCIMQAWVIHHPFQMEVKIILTRLQETNTDSYGKPKKSEGNMW